MSDFYKLGVIGQNISYSQSKDIFEAIFRLTDVHGSFDVISIDPDQLTTRFGELIEAGFTGLSITVPFKGEVLRLLDNVEPMAGKLGAVNCITIRDGRTSGSNTDGAGFRKPLDDSVTLLKGRRALIFGYGGSAAVVLYSLASEFGVRQFTVVGRDEDKWSEFRDRMTAILPDTHIVVESNEHFTAGFDDRYGVAVNCTPLGGWNFPGDSPFPKRFDWSAVDIYYDLNYNAGNRLIAAARSAGVRAIDGSIMLVGQAIESFRLWSGLSVDFDPVYRAVFGRQ